MKKLVILMALALAMSTAALANPIFQDRGAEASNPLYEGEAAPEHNGGVDILGMGAEKLSSPEDTTKPHSKYKAEIYVLQFDLKDNDPDSDGDGLLTLKSTEVIDSNQGQIVSAIKSERPKFKAGAELSKTARDNEPTSPKLLCLCSYDYLGVGDLDGDGFADVMIAADRNEETLTVAGTEISKRDARKGFIKTENSMNKAELIEAMASHAGLSKADSKKALEGVVGEIILGGADGLGDKHGNILPDCFLIPGGSTAEDFAYEIHSDIGDGFLHAIDCRDNRQISGDHKLEHRDVIEIVTSN